MSERIPKLLLQDISSSIDKISEYTDGLSFPEFLNDSKTIDAVIRNFEIIGEAANRLPEEFKEAHPIDDWPGYVVFVIALLTTTWELIFKSSGSLKKIFYPA